MGVEVDMCGSTIWELPHCVVIRGPDDRLCEAERLAEWVVKVLMPNPGQWDCEFIDGDQGRFHFADTLHARLFALQCEFKELEIMATNVPPVE